jgi:membrane associated rhomboid family serine protease
MEMNDPNFRPREALRVSEWDAGRKLAVLASLLLFAGCAAFVVAGVGLLGSYVGDSPLLANGGLPLLIYLGWMSGVFGAIAALIAIVIYRFRQRWFWRCLVIASGVWLVFPPIFTVIGLVTLLVLVRYRMAFPGLSDTRLTT